MAGLQRARRTGRGHALPRRYGHAEMQVGLDKDQADLVHMKRCLAMLEAGGQPASEPFLTAAGARQNIAGLKATIRNKRKLLGLGPRARARRRAW